MEIKTFLLVCNFFYMLKKIEIVWLGITMSRLDCIN